MKFQKYIYSLKDISDGKRKAFVATVPAFENAIVFGESVKEIEEGIECLILDEKEIARKDRKPVGTHTTP